MHICAVLSSQSNRMAVPRRDEYNGKRSATYRGATKIYQTSKDMSAIGFLTEKNVSAIKVTTNRIKSSFP